MTQRLYQALFRPSSLAFSGRIRSAYRYAKQTPLIYTTSFARLITMPPPNTNPSSATSVKPPRGRQRPTDHKTGPKGEPMTPIPSATLVVLCPRSASEPQGTTLFNTLMVQRSARVGSSFRSAVVFPGGALDLADEEAIDSAFPQRSLDSSLFSQTKQGYLFALKLCALRETFEETGLLLVPSTNSVKNNAPPFSRAIGYKEAGFSVEEWNNIRDQVHNDAVGFVPFLESVYKTLGLPSQLGTGANTLPLLAPMAHHSNWITPKSIVRPTKRFDAHFFVTILDTQDAFGAGNKTLELSADGSETLSLRLGSPEELIELAITDQISLFPPQFYILADLEAVLRGKSHAALSEIKPLIFDKAGATSYEKEAEFRVTPVEEESRGLNGRNYSWDRNDVSLPSASSNGNQPTSSISDATPPLSKQRQLDSQADTAVLQVTAIEPRPFPKLGSNVNIAKTVGNVECVDQKGDAKDENKPFIFPLVLPGDSQASPSQQDRAKKGILLPSSLAANEDAKFEPTNSVSSSSNSEESALNRLYVSPRAPELGGGLIVRGAIRRGIGALKDFQVGVLLKESSQLDKPAGNDLGKSKL